MRVTTIVGVVKNGQIQLSEEIDLAEDTIVYVMIPSLKVNIEKSLNSDLTEIEKIVKEGL